MVRHSFHAPYLKAFLFVLIALLLPLSGFAEPRCGTLELVPSPNPGLSSNALTDIAAVGDGTAWALGSQSGEGTSALALHFDGSDWNEYPLPSEADGFHFGAIGNTPEGDVWMVGTKAHSVYQVEVLYLRARNGVIDRVDSFLNGGGPVSISGSSSDNVWGVSGGIWPSDAGGYAHHFDGTDWSSMQLPASFIYRNQPQAIFAAGPDDIWIAGYGGDGRAQYMGYIQHWDGSDWERIPTPFDDQNLTYFLSIDGSSSSDIWVVGHINHAQPILLHWDGSSWTQHSGSAANRPLQCAAVPGPGNAWATPYSLTPGSPFHYWDGMDWTAVETPSIPGAQSVNWRGLTRAGSCEVWAVGSYHDGNTHHTLVSRLVTDGSSDLSATGDEVPGAATLLGNHPNPFNPATVISFDLPTGQDVDLRVYSLDGRLVRSLVTGYRAAGLNRVPWDGKDIAGRTAASGTYLYRLRHADGESTGKMTLTQ